MHFLPLIKWKAWRSKQRRAGQTLAHMTGRLYQSEEFLLCRIHGEEVIRDKMKCLLHKLQIPFRRCIKVLRKPNIKPGACTIFKISHPVFSPFVRDRHAKLSGQVFVHFWMPSTSLFQTQPRFRTICKACMITTLRIKFSEFRRYCGIVESGLGSRLTAKICVPKTPQQLVMSAWIFSR